MRLTNVVVKYIIPHFEAGSRASASVYEGSCGAVFTANHLPNAASAS